MHCHAYLLGESIRLKDFAQRYQPKAKFFSKDALYIPLTGGKCFYFAYGAVVFWGLKEKVEDHLLMEIQEYVGNPLAEKQFETLNLAYTKKTSFIEDDVIKLDTKDKLAFFGISYVIAESLKLAFFEEMIQETIEKTKSIPEELAVKGRIMLSAKEISKMRGRLFAERSYINFHFDFLNSPDFFWENPEYESYYKMTEKYFEIKSRVEVLNKKLSLIHDVFDMLSDEQKHQHSSFLEWVIIGLIAVEIAFTLFGI